MDIAGLGNTRGNFASGSSSDAVSAGDSYGAPLADPVSSGSSAPAIDEYGAPAGPILTDSSSPPEAVAPIDEYGAPAAPVQDTYPAASAAEPASDSYGAPTADVLPAPSSPAGDSYGAPTADVLPAPSSPVGDSYGAPTSDVLPASSSVVVAADSGYGAPAEAPLIQDNSFAPSSVDEATVAVGDSYGSPRDPAPRFANSLKPEISRDLYLHLSPPQLLRRASGACRWSEIQQEKLVPPTPLSNGGLSLLKRN